MSLTLGRGPLVADAARDVNYRIDGPERLLFFSEFPRRVRAVLAGETVLDTRRGRLLHETGLLPVLYVPDDDVAEDLLRPSDHTTHCPFKGDASYWSIHVGERVTEDAVWAYRAPRQEAAWLRGFKAMYWGAVDAWYDEGEEVAGHLRDPYHRVDVRAMDDLVVVRSGQQVLAESRSAKVLSETGLPNRYYVPREDVRAELQPSGTSAVCPYKGTSSYWSVSGLTDVAWSYEEPLSDAAKVGGHLCFLHDDVTVEVR